MNWMSKKAAESDAWANGIMWFGIITVVLIGFAGRDNFVHNVGLFTIIFGGYLLAKKLINR